MSVYYNEIDPFAATWLRNPINAGHLPPGHVDTLGSVTSVTRCVRAIVARYRRRHGAKRLAVEVRL